MAFPETAMRDPVFYRLHQLIDDIVQYYKSKLPEYTVEQVRINYTLYYWLKSKHETMVVF